MNLNHGVIFDPETERGPVFWCAQDECLCLNCQGWVWPDSKLVESYVNVYESPRYVTRSNGIFATLDGFDVTSLCYAAQAVPGPELGSVGEGWVAIHLAHGERGTAAPCRRCRTTRCQTVATGEVSWGFSRPMKDALAHVRTAQVSGRLGGVDLPSWLC